METICMKWQILFSRKNKNNIFTLPSATLGKIFSKRHSEIFFFSKETRFDISCKLETICMKYQILFSGINWKNIINVLSAELAKRVEKLTLNNEDICMECQILFSGKK